MLNAVRPALVLAAALLGAIAVSPASADEQSFPNWQSCGLDFWANATDLRDLRLGVPVSKQLGKNAALLAEILSEKSETDALMTIHAVYEKCVNGLVKDGQWTAEPQLIKWRDCAYQSATRFNILVAIEQGHLDDLKARLPASLRPQADVLSELASDSLGKAADFSVEAGKVCVEDAQRQAR